MPEANSQQVTTQPGGDPAAAPTTVLWPVHLDLPAQAGGPNSPLGCSQAPALPKPLTGPGHVLPAAGAHELWQLGLDTSMCPPLGPQACQEPPNGVQEEASHASPDFRGHPPTPLIATARYPRHQSGPTDEAPHRSPRGPGSRPPTGS